MSTLAKITVRENIVAVAFPEIDQTFNRLVKELGYRWERPLWARKIDARNGTPADRAVELGHRLLLAGFCVEYADEALAQRAAQGEYEPEHTRWITRYTSGKYQDWFCVAWARTDDFYTRAKRLHGARYNPPHVAVPSESFEQVLDFAEENDFRLSELAQGLANEARARWEQAVIVAPEPKRQASKPKTDAQTVGIADELKDEPL